MLSSYTIVGLTISIFAGRFHRALDFQFMRSQSLRNPGPATDHYFKEIPPMDPFEVDRITDAPIVQDVSGKLAYVRFLPRP